jgi:hypothetical protein
MNSMILCRGQLLKKMSSTTNEAGFHLHGSKEANEGHWSNASHAGPSS